LPNTNRWLSPDSIIPDPTNPQSFNRYSYVLNQPTKYIDPSGHNWECPDPDGCGLGGSNSMPDDPPPPNLPPPPPNPGPEPDDCLILQKCIENLLPLPLEGTPGITQGFSGDHAALDMISDNYTLIAIGNGIVVVVGHNEAFGHFVIIEYRYEDLSQDAREALGLHPGQSVYVQYQHLGTEENSSITVSPGDHVTAGQKVGTMGNSGRVLINGNGEGQIHLHVQIRVGGSGVLGEGTYSYGTEVGWATSPIGQDWATLTVTNPRIIWPALPEWEY